MTDAHRQNLYTSEDGQLAVYQRVDAEGNIKPTWYYDIVIPKQKRIRFKSTQFTDFGNALMYAKSEHQKMLQRVTAGIPLNAFSFDKVCKEVLEHYYEKVSVKDFPVSEYNRLRNCINHYYVPYFSEILDKDFHAINTIDIENFITWRKKRGVINSNAKGESDQYIGRMPSNNTINKELNSLRKIYDYAIDRGLMLPAQKPKIKNLKYSISDNRREHFTEPEWRKIYTYLSRKYAPWNDKTKGDSKFTFEVILDNYIKLLHRHFWLILSQSSGRVGEIRNIRWRDVKIREFSDSDGKTVKRQILNVSGKTGQRHIVCMPSALDTFERWREICDWYRVTCNPDDYVFRHPHFSRSDHREGEKPVHDTYNGFKRVLTALNLLYYGDEDENGKRPERTLYSIRHSGITWALQRNVPIEAISKNVGTSIQTLQKVYDHSVSSDYMSLITQNDPTHRDRRTKD